MVRILPVVIACCFPVIAAAQPATGNRANGLDYQPSPGEVVPRERAAGVNLPPAQRNATDRELQAIDRQLLGNRSNMPPVKPQQ